MKYLINQDQLLPASPPDRPTNEPSALYPGLAALLYLPHPTLAFKRTTRRLLLWNSALQELSGHGCQAFPDIEACLKGMFYVGGTPKPALDGFFNEIPPGRSQRFTLVCQIRSGERLNLEATVWDAPTENEPTSSMLFPRHCRIVQFSSTATPDDGLLESREHSSVLKRYQLWLDLALESLNKGMWTMHFSPGQSHYHSLVFTSPNALKMLGYSPEEIADNPLTWDKLTHPDDFPEILRRMREHIFEARTDHYEAEFRVKTKDGRWQWLLSYGRVTRRDEQGRPLEAMGTHIDIDRIKLAEENLQKSEARFRTLVENMPLGIMLVEKNRSVDYTNPKFKDIFGYDEASVPTFEAWLELAYQNDEARAEAANFLAAPEDKSGLSIVLCAGGESKHVRAHMVELPFERCLLAYEDVTAQVHSEQALRNREQELQEKSQTLEDINTALRVVLNQKSSTQSDLKSTLYINLRDLVLPHLDELENALQTGAHSVCLDTVRAGLKHMADLCRGDLTLADLNLTARERQLAEMIKNDMTSSRIAAKLGLSESAVEFHRNNIRRKLGIAKQKVNLKTYLKAMP